VVLLHFLLLRCHLLHQDGLPVLFSNDHPCWLFVCNAIRWDSEIPSFFFLWDDERARRKKRQLSHSPGGPNAPFSIFRTFTS
jgi:hypothetical protein